MFNWANQVFILGNLKEGQLGGRKQNQPTWEWSDSKQATEPHTGKHGGSELGPLGQIAQCVEGRAPTCLFDNALCPCLSTPVGAQSYSWC